jgi:hypothetical protein
MILNLCGRFSYSVPSELCISSCTLFLFNIGSFLWWLNIEDFHGHLWKNNFLWSWHILEYKYYLIIGVWCLLYFTDIVPFIWNHLLKEIIEESPMDFKSKITTSCWNVIDKFDPSWQSYPFVYPRLSLPSSPLPYRIIVLLFLKK